MNHRLILFTKKLFGTLICKKQPLTSSISICSSVTSHLSFISSSVRNSLTSRTRKTSIFRFSFFKNSSNSVRRSLCVHDVKVCTEKFNESERSRTVLKCIQAYFKNTSASEFSINISEKWREKNGIGGGEEGGVKYKHISCIFFFILSLDLFVSLLK